jgi:hypothetical protein
LGRQLQVTGKDKNFDVLAPHVTDDGRGLLLVALHRGTGQKARTFSEFIEVRVNGQHVGQVTGASSARGHAGRLACRPGACAQHGS